MNQTFQLQRLAHEELGCGTWTHAADAIPTTQRGEKLSLIDTSDPDHPILLATAPGDHASVQESEAKPDQGEETLHSEGLQTALEPTPVNEVLSTGQSNTSNGETSHLLHADAGSTQQTNKTVTVLHTVSVNGSEEGGSSSSSRDEGDAFRAAENREPTNASSIPIENNLPMVSRASEVEGPMPSRSSTV